MAVFTLGAATFVGTVAADYYSWNDATFERLADGRYVAVFETGLFGLPGQGGPSALRSVLMTSSGSAIGSIQTVSSVGPDQFTGASQVTGTGSGGYFITYESGPQDSGPETGDVFGQVYGGTGTATTAAFNLPTDISNGEFDNDIIRLQNGNYLATWSDLGTTTGTGLNTEIIGQVFTEAGARVGAEFQLNQDSADLQLGHGTVTLSDGRMLTVWTEGTLTYDPVTGDPQGLNSTKFEARFLSAAGVPSGADIVLVTPTGGFRPADETNSFDLLAQPDGGFVLAWIELNGTASQEETSVTYRIMVQRFDSAGVAVGSATGVREVANVNETTQPEPFEMIVLLQVGGNVVVNWREIPSNTPPSPMVLGGTFDASGAFSSTLPATSLNTANGVFGDIIAIEESNGTAVRALLAQNNGQGQLTYSSVEIELFGSNVTRIGGFQSLGTVSDQYYESDDATLERLADGSFAASFRTGQFGQNEQSGPSNLRSVLMTAGGTVVGSIETVASVTAGNYIGDARITGTSTNGYFVTYETDTEDGGPTTGDVAGRVFANTGGAATGSFVLPTDLASGEFSAEANRLSNGNYLVTWSDIDSSALPALDSEVIGQVFTEAGVRVGSEFQINQNDAGLQLGNTSVVLSDGRILYLWSDGTLVNDPVTGEPIGITSAGYEGRFYSAAGVALGGDILLATPTNGFSPSNEQGATTALALADGGFALAWTEDNGTPGGPETDLTFRIVMQRFDSAGVAVGAASVVRTVANINSTLQPDPFEGIELLQVGTEVVLFWHEVGSFGPSAAHVYGGHWDAGGAFVRTLSLRNLESIGGYADVLAIEANGGTTVRALVAQNIGADQISYGTVVYNLFPQEGVLDGTPDDDNLSGTGAAEIIRGFEGNDTLMGLGGADTLDGGSGNDVYIVDQTGDVIIDASGIDMVVAQSTYSLAAGIAIELLVATGGTAVINLTGNALAQSLTGNEAANTLDGRGGADTMTGFGGADLYYVDHAGDLVLEQAGGGTDRIIASVNYSLGLTSEIERMDAATGTTAINLIGNDLAQSLIGNAGNNALNGRGGADAMSGLAGNDTYFVDSLGDVPVETVGNGVDRVVTSITFALRVGSEIERMDALAGTAAINLYGNELVQALNGNEGANILDGKVGGDVMTGFAGNDIYFVDTLQDVVIEAAGGGIDRITASLTYALRAGQEIERLDAAAGTTAINLYGNELVQALNGNAGNNVLDGRGGADVMTGYAGNDVYFVDNLGDVVVEAVGGGVDRITVSFSYVLRPGSEIERIDAAVGTAAIDLTGNEYGQSLLGNAGSNTLNGRLGNDVLFGGAGMDTFAFNTGLNATVNVDVISDFSVTDDSFALENGIMTGLGATTGVLDATKFVIGTAAADASDRIIYNSATGVVSYDADGTGASFTQVAFARLTAGLALTSADFIVM